MDPNFLWDSKIPSIVPGTPTARGPYVLNESMVLLLLSKYIVWRIGASNPVRSFAVTIINFKSESLSLNSSTIFSCSDLSIPHFFLNSKIFNWLISKLKNSENQEIYFGSLSSIIHNGLLDDPKPYRQDVKKLQVNLYGYIKHFKPANLQIDIPKVKSERIKLI